MYSPASTVPFEIPMKSRLVLLPDIHRDLRKAKAILRHCNVTNSRDEWNCYDTILVQMGDQIDGGKRHGQPSNLPHQHGKSTKEDIEVLRFFNNLDKQASERNSMCISLLGNHEIMNVCGDYNYADINDCPICRSDRKTMFSPTSNLCKELASTRACIVKIGPFLLSHAGVTPRHLALVNGNLDKYNETARGLLLGSGNMHSINILIGENGLLSHRDYHPASVNITTILNVDEVLAKTNTKHMITGHNTIPGQVPIFGRQNQLIVFDPGMSEAVADQKPTALDIRDQNINVIRVE